MGFLIRSVGKIKICGQGRRSSASRRAQKMRAGDGQKFMMHDYILRQMKMEKGKKKKRRVVALNLNSIHVEKEG